MPSRVSFFNPAVYRKNLTRFAPLWLAYLALWLILLPMNISDRGYSWLNVWSLRYMVMDSSFEFTIIISLVYAILVAMALHGWYYRNASVNAIAALPIRRETWFCTNLITALTVGLIPNMIVALATWASAASIGIAGGVAAMCWLAINSLVYLFFYALAAFCAAIVGQILALPALYILVNFTAVVVSYVTVTILSCFVYGMNAHRFAVLAPLSPAYYLFTRTSAQYEYRDEFSHEVVNIRFLHWGYLLGLTVAAVVLLAIAFLLFRRRRMEAAGDMIAVRPLRPVFKYCFATGCALVLGTLAAFLTARHGIESYLPVKLLCWLLAGGFVGYFTAEILLKKTFRVFGREWIGFGVFALCLTAAVLLMEFDVTGFERRIPNLEDVESVHIQAFYRGSGDFTVEDPAVIADFMALHRAIIQDKKNQDILSRPEHDDEASSAMLYLDYNLRGGKVMERQYSIYCTPEQWNCPDSPGRLMCELLSRPDNLVLSVLPEFPIRGPENILSAQLDNGARGVIEETGGKYGDQPVTDAERNLNLSQEEAWRIFNDCILPDLRDGKIGMPEFYYFQDLPQYNAYIEFSFVKDPYTKDQQIHSWVNLNLTPGSRTAQYFIDRGCTLLTDEEITEMYDLYYEREQQQ